MVTTDEPRKRGRPRKFDPADQASSAKETFRCRLCKELHDNSLLDADHHLCEGCFKALAEAAVKKKRCFKCAERKGDNALHPFRAHGESVARFLLCYRCGLVLQTMTHEEAFKREFGV